jgi:cyclic pyranopterin phosphate synthase
VTDQTLTHFDAAGQAHMVDVGSKAETRPRRSRRRQHLHATGNAGADPLWVGQQGRRSGYRRIAAIQASKRTGELIPLCHPVALTKVAADFTVDEMQSACIARSLPNASAAPALKWKR